MIKMVPGTCVVLLGSVLGAHGACHWCGSPGQCVRSADRQQHTCD